MITLTIIAFGFLLLVGGAALLHAIQHAPEGYEDEQGFHECVNSRPPGALKTAVAARRPKRAATRAYGVL
jgi:hypothetical protein